MASVLEKSWFKWMIVGTTFSVLFVVLGVGFLQEYLKQKEIERIEYAKYEVQREYEDQFRTSMTRLYQNLKLDHFLAAYQNVKNMPGPKMSDRPRVDEYTEALHRIGQGLIKAGLLKEAEAVYGIIRDYVRESTEASTALTEIQSRRRLQFARSNMMEGRRLLAEKKYKAAFAELQKADVEINAARSYNFTEIGKEVAELQALTKEARFFVRMEDAEANFAKAKKSFELADYNATQNEMAKSANLVGRAAFLMPDAKEVIDLRKRLRDLDTELGYAIPNSFPLMNAFKRDMVGRDPSFFYLESYDFNMKPDAKNVVHLKLNYLRARSDAYYIVRYRIYLADNRDFFNGHFLMPKNDQKTDDEIFTVDFEQEVPEKFRGLQIKRVEVNISNQKDVLVARVMRTFKPGS